MAFICNVLSKSGVNGGLFDAYGCPNFSSINRYSKFSSQFLLVFLFFPPFRLCPCMSRPPPDLLFKGESKASACYEEPRVLCRAVLSNNKQWRQRFSIRARKREGGRAETQKKKEREEARLTWKWFSVREILCLRFSCLVNTVRQHIKTQNWQLCLKKKDI